MSQDKLKTIRSEDLIEYERIIARETFDKYLKPRVGFHHTRWWPFLEDYYNSRTRYLNYILLCETTQNDDRSQGALGYLMILLYLADKELNMSTLVTQIKDLVSGRRFTLPNGVGIGLPSATDDDHEVELFIPKSNRRLIEELKALENKAEN